MLVTQKFILNKQNKQIWAKKENTFLPKTKRNFLQISGPAFPENFIWKVNIMILMSFSFSCFVK